MGDPTPAINAVTIMMQSMQANATDREQRQHLEEQLLQIPQLEMEEPFGPSYKVWKMMTGKIVLAYLGQDAFDLYEKQFRLKTTIRRGTEQYVQNQLLKAVKQLIDTLMKEKQRFGSKQLPMPKETDVIEKYNFHPTISKVSGKLFFDGSYAEAIRAAMVEVNNRVKAFVIKTSGVTLDGADLMNRVFSANPPMIKFNAFVTESEKNEQEAFGFLFRAIIGIRNIKSHQNVVQKDYNKAVEYLGIANLLMRLLDDAKIDV
jgi:uncharacterized protein (TIGR02391 family)